MMYNKAELKAMQMIASKLNWHKPAYETVETITKMVRNQQSLELDCIGECDDFEETLLSLALWNADKIMSTLFVNDYRSLVDYKYNMFLEDMGITNLDYLYMLEYYTLVSGDAVATDEEIELEDYYHYLDLCDDYAYREY